MYTGACGGLCQGSRGTDAPFREPAVHQEGRHPQGITTIPRYSLANEKSLTVPEGVNGVHVGRPPGRVHPGDDADRYTYTHGGRDVQDTCRLEEICRCPHHRLHHRVPYSYTADPADTGTQEPEDECFIEEHPAHLPAFRTDRDQDTDLLYPFAHGHHHHVEDTHGCNEEGDRTDRHDERGHGAQGCRLG